MLWENEIGIEIMNEKIEQDYEEGLKFLITNTGEDTTKTADAEKKVTTFLMIQEWRDRASRVENGEDVFDLMSEADMDNCQSRIHKIVKEERAKESKGIE